MILMRSLDISIDLILLAALWPRGHLSLLTEMSTRNLPGGKGQPVPKADKLAGESHNPMVLQIWLQG
jgi:hypothetical protein